MLPKLLRAFLGRIFGTISQALVGLFNALARRARYVPVMLCLNLQTSRCCAGFLVYRTDSQTERTVNDASVAMGRLLKSMMLRGKSHNSVVSAGNCGLLSYAYSSEYPDEDTQFFFVGRVPVHPIDTGPTEYRLTMKTIQGDSPENEEGRSIRLNWSTLIAMQIVMPDFRINESDPSYALYQDALQHFTSTYIQGGLSLSALGSRSPEAVYHPNRTFSGLLAIPPSSTSFSSA
ncbi:hypothetical protein NUW54_g9519 [Trametes sanguinea]|uniref:Uncharacterized protein n=1 Tax=Trametes sanguinea TaxID=158606 RepID=A0ACC1P6W5_9APHY|nr:hypothetical protein NUW54_g9519 [Trametes sanguinea]